MAHPICQFAWFELAACDATMTRAFQAVGLVNVEIPFRNSALAVFAGIWHLIHQTTNSAFHLRSERFLFTKRTLFDICHMFFAQEIAALNAGHRALQHVRTDWAFECATRKAQWFALCTGPWKYSSRIRKVILFKFIGLVFYTALALCTRTD